MKVQKDKTLNIRLPSTMLENLQQHKKATGVPISETIRRAVDTYIKKVPS